ncbi:MAG TPA: tetratricopeptide repeat protein [Thermoanaerobaculia bacterium]
MPLVPGSRKIRFVLVAVLAVALGVYIAMSRRDSATRIAAGSLRNANVLLVTFDTTRADRIGAYGYAGARTPNLDALARDGALFETCITPTAYTLPSHSSIMTGLYPPYHGVRVNGAAALADVHTTLAERLRAAGYRTGAFVGAFVLDRRWGLGQGFDHYDDEFKLGKGQKLDLARVQRPANAVVDAALAWLGEKSAKPFFAWVHFYDPHVAYAPPEPFRTQFAGGGESGLYDGEIAFADSQLGRLLQWLDAQGISKDTIVVVVGDHGEGLGSHGESEHGYYIYDYAIHVPLIMRIPGAERGVRVPAQVRTVDILPTLVDLVSGETADPVHGASLVPLLSDPAGEPVRYAYSESVAIKLQYGWAALYGIRTNEHKFIEAPRSELYELTKDPGEATNRYADLRRVSLQLRGELEKIRNEIAKGAPEAAEANVDQETMKMLASLGYVSGGSAEDLDDSTLADPKDKYHLFDSIGYAANLLSKDDDAEAAEVLEIVLADDPNIPQAQILLASTYKKLGRRKDAKRILDAYLTKDPGNAPALISMAEILLEEGKREEVMAICRQALAKDPRNARAYELMAETEIADRDHAAALPLLRKAIELQPKLSRSRLNLAAALIALGQHDEAGQLLDGIVKEYPKFPLANFHLGLLREEQGRFAEARAAYEKEVAANPKAMVAHFNLGNLLLRGGDLAGAEAQMGAILAEDPENPRAHLLLARALMENPRRLAEAERNAMIGLEGAREPEMKALGWFLLADVYSRQGRRPESRAAAAKGQQVKAQIKG